MLTPKEIKEACGKLYVYAAPETRVFMELAAAYERVMALRTELVDFMASSHARPMLAITDVLRKLDGALEG
jgi:hypothetical protein